MLRNYGYASVKSAQKCVNSTHKSSKNCAEAAQPQTSTMEGKRISLGKGTELAKKLRIFLIKKSTKMR